MFELDCCASSGPPAGGGVARGSRAWMVVAVGCRAASGCMRYVARDGDRVLYRTRVVPGDQFEITATPARSKGRRKTSSAPAPAGTLRA